MPHSYPSLPKFDYLRPNSLEEASEFLSKHGEDSRPFLGGTDCFVRMRDGQWRVKTLVDIKAIPTLDEIRFHENKGLHIGCAITMNQIIANSDTLNHYPLLVQTASSVASYPLRNRATLIGNICNASPAGDTICAALLYEGILIIHTPDGEREEPLHSFFQGPGKTTLKSGEIVAAIQLPPSPVNQQTTYLKLGRNRAGDLSVVGVGVIGYPDSTAASGIRFRIALASVAPMTLRVEQAESILSSAPIDEQLIKEVCTQVRDACQPIDDVRATAEYRKEMAYNLTLQAVTDIYHRLQTINS